DIARIWVYILALGLLAAGLFLTIGGAILLMRGGSWYFAAAGLLTLVSAIQLARGRSSGAWLFLATFAGTVAWALIDVGLDYWGLISRLLAITFLAAVVAFTLPLLRNRAADGPASRPGVLIGAVL